jgi:hypothetical protein
VFIISTLSSEPVCRTEGAFDVVGEAMGGVVEVGGLVGLAEPRQIECERAEHAAQRRQQVRELLARAGQPVHEDDRLAGVCRARFPGRDDDSVDLHRPLANR